MGTHKAMGRSLLDTGKPVAEFKPSSPQLFPESGEPTGESQTSELQVQQGPQQQGPQQPPQKPKAKKNPWKSQNKAKPKKQETAEERSQVEKPVTERTGPSREIGRQAVRILRKTWDNLFILRYYNPLLPDSQIRSASPDEVPTLLVSLYHVYSNTNVETEGMHDAVLAAMRQPVQQICSELSTAQREELVMVVFGKNKVTRELYEKLFPEVE